MASPRRPGAAVPDACSLTCSSRWTSSRAARSTRRSSAPTATAPRPSGCSRRGDDHRRPARARRRGALRPRPHRPLGLPRRPRRRQARHARRRQALPVRARLLLRRAHAAGRDGRPGQRAGRRRHRGDDRLRGAPGRLFVGGHRAAARAPRGPRLRQRRVAPDIDDDGDSDVVAPTTAGALGPDVRPLAPERADRLRLRRGGLVGHPARAPGDQGRRRARRVRHPLRARRRRDARPLPHRRRAPGGGHGAPERRSRPSPRA